MYRLINENVESAIAEIQQNDTTHVTEYDYIVQNVRNCRASDYQERYRKFWGMYSARLSEPYCATYFERLAAALENPPSIGEIVEDLYRTPTHGNGRNSVQFSFATKLLHMANPHLPIYDSKVVWFYFFVEPPSDNPTEKISKLVAFYDFLVEEYARIVNNGLLAPAISEFRARLGASAFTDEKIIDSLIWAFVVRLNGGALTRREISYGTEARRASAT